MEILIQISGTVLIIAAILTPIIFLVLLVVGLLKIAKKTELLEEDEDGILKEFNNNLELNVSDDYMFK